MAHFDEMTCMLYLDGQLDSLRAGELELHTRSCSPCRALLSALEREATFLRSSVTEEFESVPAHLLAPPQPDRMPWGWISVLGTACAGLYSVVSLFDGYANQFSQAGFSSMHVMGQAFSNAVFWKGWSDVMTAIAIISVLALTLPLLWFGWKNLKRIKPVAIVLAGLTAMLLLPAPAAATKIHSKQTSFTVAEGETVKEDLIILGQSVRIEGTVEGDVIVFAESVTVTGHITGDLLAFTRRLRMDGKVDGSIRGIANQSDIEGQVGRNVTFFGEGFDLSEKGVITGGIMLFAASADIDGGVGRDLLAFVDKLRVNGSIAGDIVAESNGLRLGSRSAVGGKIDITGRRAPEVLNHALQSKVEFTLDAKKGPDYTKPGYYWRHMLKFGAAFFFGLIFMILLPGFYDDVMRQGKRYGPALGVGFLTLVASPLLAALACITLVGLAIGIGGLILWIVLLYAAQIAVGGWLGTRILGDTHELPARLGRLALGLVIVRVLGSLPYVSFYVWLVVLAWGMGAIMLALFRTFRASMDSAAPLPAPVAPPAPAM